MEKSGGKPLHEFLDGGEGVDRDGCGVGDG